MRIFPVKINTRRAGVAALLIGATSVVSVQACTDLKETPTSALSPDNYYNTSAEVIGGLAGVYANLRTTLDDYWNAGQVSSDETVVPTRGADWYDGGAWLDLKRQTFTANSPSSGTINGAWVNLWSGVAKANAVLSALSGKTVPNQKAITAELRALRALYYICLMDGFGNVPIVTTTEIKPRAQDPRADVFKFVETELLAARADLPAKWDAANYGRLTQGAADAMLVSIYLNAQIYGGTVTASGITPGAARWADVVTVADRIINSGTYTLASEWKSNFVYNNQNSPENIMVIRFSTVDGLGLVFNNRALHYNSWNFGGWNGFSTVSDVYNAFDPTDVRRNMFLAGPQVNLSTGAPAKDRAGNPLVFTVDFKDITQAAENEGARFYKYPVDPTSANQNMGNDYAYFRLGEMFLAKAEALNEQGQTAAAIALVNQVRTRAFTTAKPISTGLSQTQARTAIFNERLFELAGEGKRRQDQIRAGTYTKPFQFKPGSDAWKAVWPIPQSQLSTNPLLKQNPGY